MEGQPYERFSRVHRLHGRAQRVSAPPGAAADYMHARAEYDETRRKALAAALRAFRRRLDPADKAATAHAEAVLKMFAKYMASIGYFRSAKGWRKRLMSVETFTKLDGAESHSGRELNAATDLWLTARDAVLTLVAGDDAERRAALAAELGDKQKLWLVPGDPPAIAHLANGLALAWLLQTFFALESARGARAGIPDAQQAELSARYAAADKRFAALHRDLLSARSATVEWEARKAKLADLKRKARNRNRKARDRALPGTPRRAP